MFQARHMLNGGRALGLLLLIATIISPGMTKAADPLPTPTGPVLLTLSGNISVTNQGDEAVFDREMLKAVDAAEVKTKTHWDTGVSLFSGPRLGAVLDRVGASGTTLIVTGLDGYVAEIPFEDARNFGVILAMARDGKIMTVRTKGPIWVIYPLDQYSELNSEKYSARSVWQVQRIEVK